MSVYNRECRRSACRALTKHKSGFCRSHYTGDQARYDREVRDPAARKFYTSSRWRKNRKMKLHQHPMCQCNECRGVGEVATMVHHIDGDRNNNLQDNLMSMARSCHETHHARVGDRWKR